MRGRELYSYSIRPSSGDEALAWSFFRDAAGVSGKPSRLHGQLHRARHPHRVLSLRDARVHQHAGGAELHRHGRVAGGADAGVDDHRHFALLDDDAYVGRVAIAMPMPEPIGAPSGMTAAAPNSSSFLHTTGSSLV